jgi:hypothetical protein
MLIAADFPDGVHWRVGLQQLLRAITRYNHSAFVRHGGRGARGGAQEQRGLVERRASATQPAP